MSTSFSNRNEPVERRLNWLHERLRTGEPMPLREHVEAHRIHPRTAEADMIRMRQDWGAPVDYDESRRVWRYTDLKFEPSHLYFAPAEAALLRRVLVTGRADLPAPEQANLDLLISRLFNHARRTKPSKYASADTGVHFPMDDSTLWNDCETAINERIPMEIEYGGLYREENDLPSRVVEPQRLHAHGGEWYVIAWCRERRALRTFHLGRFRQHFLRDGDLPFERQPAAAVDAEIRDGLQMMTQGEQVQVVIDFDRYQARWIKERSVHETQELTELPGGGVRMTLRVRGLPAVQRWVMQFGEHAQVREPAELRESLAASAKKVTALYEGM